ncbi:MFS transporter [Parapedobacter pyrenivorans]|uniref:MFS transporter n=1 Tax=Parapedobacter pyrenivorans TaxID=1305674 RepID=UPI0033424A88
MNNDKLDKQTLSMRRLKAIAGGSIGNLVEWYDWYTYSAFAIYFSASFFPNDNQTVQLLQTAGIFALGFLMRPIGGWLFGALADNIGRKKTMLISVWLMSIGSLIIAFIPDYSTIGILAPLLLTIARMLQGLSVGGEFGVSATYLTEMATPNRRGFFSSFQYATLIGGQLLALGVQILLQKFLLTDEQLHDWGWRIPFVIGAILSVIALYLRVHLHETRAYTAAKEKGKAKDGSISKLLKHPKAIMIVVGLTLGGTLAFYTFTTYMQKFLVNTVGISKGDATMISFVSLFAFAVIQPLFGGLSDRIGRKPLLITFGLLGTICTVPLMNAISSANSNWAIFVFIMIGLLIISTYTSIGAVVKAELFPAEVRAIGVGLPHAITVAIFGGTAEYVALWFKSIDHESWYYWYVTIGIFLSLIMFVFMQDTKKGSKLDGEPHG